MTEELGLKESLIATYEKQNPALRDEQLGLASFRNAAFQSFQGKGFPGRKQEEYRYLNFEPVLKSVVVQANGLNGLIASTLPDWDTDCFRVVLVNGCLHKEYSRLEDLPESVLISDLSESLHTRNIHALSTLGTLAHTDVDPFIALNSALFSDGVFIYIPDGVHLEKPIHLVMVNEGEVPVFAQPRILVVSGNHASATIVQSYCSSGKQESFTNTLSEILTGENSKINWICVQLDEQNYSQVNTTEAHVKKHGNFHAVTFTLGGKLVRNNLQIVLDSAECEAHLYGYYHPRQGQTFDNHTLVDHRMPRCESNELYKGVLEGNAVAVFNGKVFVRKDAQKTNAYQNNKNILLSDEATINTKPQLEIYADDVKCSHGSSTGFLDPEQIFYLRSRGISLDKARILLLKAYADDIMEQVSYSPLREYLENTLAGRLA